MNKFVQTRSIQFKRHCVYNRGTRAKKNNAVILACVGEVPKMLIRKHL